MPPLPRPPHLSRLAKSLAPNRTAAIAATNQAQARAFTSTTVVRAADQAHEDHYDPPSGWLFGVKPGEKAEKEGWETIWVWGFFGSLGLATVAYAFKPDTS